MRGQGERGTRWSAAVTCLVALALGTTLLSGCIGATAREDFTRAMAERSGGVSGLLVTRALDAVGERLGTDNPSMRSVHVDGGSRTVTMEVVDPRDPSKLDTYAFHDATLEDPQPILVTGSTSVERDTFRVQEVPVLSSMGGVVRVALGKLGIEDALVRRITVRRGTEGVRVSVEASSARSAGTATFDADGKLLDARRS
ncbi:hypothetical protein KSP35_21205 [Aquihabitans sp. G128]|uniref:hypothetical protein n=1 Tax=Aquihabitans sp. G128 TaxID=2849779 RepID=UPI001C2365D0|nr:hypothetical protein [Aquihabitans sp. G128]QXC60810.1 hypothetical protein KSP35_21205 [Aquihabitans sp. G128]